MTPLSPTALEAAAKAMEPKAFETFSRGYTQRNYFENRAFLNAEKVVKRATNKATAAITAYLAQMEKEGFVMVPARTAQSLASFLEWAMRDGPWDGDDLDGASVQDKAESLGLITATKFDPKTHGDKPWASPGDAWFAVSDEVSAMLAAAQNGGE